MLILEPDLAGVSLEDRQKIVNDLTAQLASPITLNTAQQIEARINIQTVRDSPGYNEDRVQYTANRDVIIEGVTVLKGGTIMLYTWQYDGLSRYFTYRSYPD